MGCVCGAQEDRNTEQVMDKENPENEVESPFVLRPVSLFPRDAVLPLGTEKNPRELVPQTWIVELTKDPDKNSFGLDIQVDAHKTLVVARLPKGGPALTWNHAHHNQGFAIGDIIEAVNGVQGDGYQLLAEIRHSKSVNLSMKRIVDYTVFVTKDVSLGLDVAERDGRLVVQTVWRDGDIWFHNTRCRGGYRVVPGNWLIAVGGMSGSPQELSDKLQILDSGIVSLRFRRTPPTCKL